MKILIALLLMTVTASAQKLGAWGWMLQTNAVFNNASNIFLGGIYFPTLYGATNYFDNSAGTNGPITLGVQHASLNNLIEDMVVGPNAKFFFNFSVTPGDAGYGQFFLNTIHNGASPSGANTEWQITMPSHIAVGPGFGNLNSGHIQLGIGAGQGYNFANYWAYLQECGPLAQNSATGFSGGLVFRTSELQGANQVDHYPGLLAYSLKTNAPGRYVLAMTTEFGNTGSEVWDPNTTKAKEHIAMFDGDTNFTRIRGQFSFTNLTANSSNIISVDETAPAGQLVVKMPVWIQQAGNLDLGNTLTDTAFGSPELSIIKANHAVSFNQNNSQGTWIDFHNNSSQHAMILDPSSTAGFGGSWIGFSFRVNDRNPPQSGMAMDVIGKTAFSDAMYLTNGVPIIGTGTSQTPMLTNFTSYASGTAYTLTITPAQLAFGTTSPSITIANGGTYLITAGVGVKYAAATYAGAQTVTLKLRRTNNTAADLSNGSRAVELPVLTSFTGGDFVATPTVVYTATAGDIIQIFGSVSATPSAGSVQTDSAEIVAIRLF